MGFFKKQYPERDNFWTPSRADRGPINLVPSVRLATTTISREHFIQLGMKLEHRKTLKVTEAEFFRKFLVFGNRAQKVKFGPNFGFVEIS